MKFGVQLFGPLRGMQGDVLSCLEAMAQAGITQVEPCVSPAAIPGLERMVWPTGWLLEHGDEIKQMGLTILSAHVFAQDLTGALGGLIDLAGKVGLRQYVVKSPQQLDKAALQQTALTYMQAADRLAQAGVALLLHNEAADIQAKIGGRTAYEYLLDLCQGKVQAQVDTGWVQYGGEDPAAFLSRNAWRVKSLHHKDFPAGAQEPIDVPIGTGGVDIPGCFRLGMAWDVPQLLDQEHFGPDVPAELAAACARLNKLTVSRQNTISYLNTYNTETGEVKTLARFDKVIEAPNWLKNSDTLLFNAEGRMYAYHIPTGAETLVDTGLCTNCNNDHVVSPDETQLAVSHMTHSESGFNSQIYTLPLQGGAPRLATPLGPSFLHGWSPDGQELAYCAFRQTGGQREVDVYTIPITGGEEKRLTQGGFNDGPEYSPDGRHIWYNSTKSGLMQIWRMDKDGQNQTQITFNRRNNWFAHLSPDGQKVAYISYGENQLEPHEHLPNMPVELWLMDADGQNQRKVLSLFGGQGSMNVNAWAGDSRRFAFVSYELV